MIKQLLGGQLKSQTSPMIYGGPSELRQLMFLSGPRFGIHTGSSGHTRGVAKNVIILLLHIISCLFCHW